MLFQKAHKKTERTDRKNEIKKERKRSPWHFTDPFPPTNGVNPCCSEKVSFCALETRIKRASIAVETVLVLPLFFLGMITMISFMDIYKIQTEHFQSLCEKAKEAGMYAYVADDKGPEEITLPDVYSYTPVGGLIPLPKVWMHNTVKVHAWTGASQENGISDGKEPEEMVYVTETGSVYHKKAGCRYLNLSLDQVSGSSISSRRNQYGKKYAPCESCSRNQPPAGSVYITGTGNRYHNQATCSGLKRTVKLVKQSQVSGLHACSKCG